MIARLDEFYSGESSFFAEVFNTGVLFINVNSICFGYYEFRLGYLGTKLTINRLVFFITWYY